MKLSIDCIRDVLMELEALDMGSFGLEHFPESVKKYGETQVSYTFAKLKEARYIMGDVAMDEGGYYHFFQVQCMTYSGHQLLAQIRDEKRWTTVKTILSSVRDYSLSAITAASEGVTKAAIDKVLGELDGGEPVIRL